MTPGRWDLRKDGIDQDAGDDDQPETDEGFDGIDNLERGWSGRRGRHRRARNPAAVQRPLRGIEVRIRQIEVSTGQVRQVSVVGDFTN